MPLDLGRERPSVLRSREALSRSGRTSELRPMLGRSHIPLHVRSLKGLNRSLLRSLKTLFLRSQEVMSLFLILLSSLCRCRVSYVAPILSRSTIGRINLRSLKPRSLNSLCRSSYRSHKSFRKLILLMSLKLMPRGVLFVMSLCVVESFSFKSSCIC